MSPKRKPKLPAPAPARRDGVNALRQSARHLLAGALAGAADAPAPGDMDVFRLALARRIETLLGSPHRCRAPICRRSKVCADIAMRCQRDVARLAISPEQEARALAQVQHALKRALAARGADEA